jgi:hypothetical protein
MPAVLTTPAQVDQWLAAQIPDALGRERYGEGGGFPFKHYMISKIAF